MTEISKELTELLTVLKAGLIGDIEARNGLEAVIPWFAEARDPQVDDQIRAIAEFEQRLSQATGDPDGEVDDE